MYIHEVLKQTHVHPTPARIISSAAYGSGTWWLMAHEVLIVYSYLQSGELSLYM